MNAQLIANTVASSHHHDSVNAGENKNRNQISADAAKEKEEWLKRQRTHSLKTETDEVKASALTESFKNRMKGM